MNLTGELLRQARTDRTGAVTEVRRLADGPRPPDLDGPGLVEAVRAPESLPMLPGAVEVAAYRIAIEAVADVGRASPPGPEVGIRGGGTP